MRYIISEKQLLNILTKSQISDDLDYEHVSNAEPECDDYVVGKEVDEQSDEPSISTASDTSSSSSTSDDYGSSPAAKDYPPYPEVGHWESGVERGAANQIAMNSKWSDVVGSKLTRGHANPLK